MKYMNNAERIIAFFTSIFGLIILIPAFLLYCVFFLLYLISIPFLALFGIILNFFDKETK